MTFPEIDEELNLHDAIVLNSHVEYAERNYSCGYAFGLRIAQGIMNHLPQDQWQFCFNKEKNWVKSLYLMIGAPPGSYFDAAQDGITRAAAIVGIQLSSKG